VQHACVCNLCIQNPTTATIVTWLAMLSGKCAATSAGLPKGGHLMKRLGLPTHSTLQQIVCEVQQYQLLLSALHNTQHGALAAYQIHRC
jgi:hypothetical protein